MTITNKEILIKARGFIERGWTQRASARAAEGYPVRSKSPNACEWCASGAIRVVLPNSRNIKEFWDYFSQLVKPHLSLIEFNDDPKTTKEDVLAVFDEGIARCEENAFCPICNQHDTANDAGNCSACGEIGIIEV